MAEPENRPGTAGFTVFDNQRRISVIEEQIGLGPAVVTKTIERLDLNVRIDGNDTTGDGSEGFPFRTLPAALAVIPDNTDHTTFVHFGSGTYTASAIGVKGLRAEFGIIGDGAGAEGDDGFTVVKGSTIADTGTDATQVVDPDAPLSLDVFLDFTIELLTGPGAGQRRTIEEVLTTGEIIPARPFDVTPDNTTTYRIIRPAVILEVDGGLEFFSGVGPLDEVSRAGNPRAPFMLINVQLKAATAGVVAGGVFNFVSAHCLLHGVEFFGAGAGGNTLVYFSHCEVNIGFDDRFTGLAKVPARLGLTALDTDWAGWGFSIPVPTSGNPAANVFFVGTSMVSGYFNAVSLFTQATSRVTLEWSGGRLRGGLTLQGGSIFTQIGGVIDDTVSVGGFGVESAFIGFIGELRSSGNLLEVDGHGRADIFSTLTGTSTGGDAIVAMFGCLVTLFGAPALEGDTPASSYVVDDGSDSAASFAGVGDSLVTANGTTAIIRRA